MTNESPASETVASLLAGRGDEWRAAIPVRHSRRHFDGRPVAPDILDALEAVCAHCSRYPDARVVLLKEPRIDVFRGIIGSYGKVAGAPHVLAVIADEHSAVSHLHAGFTGEIAILEATALGLDTCWVGGFFRPRRAARLVQLMPQSGERIVAVSPVGHAAGSEPSGSERFLRGLAHSHERKALSAIALHAEDWPNWARAAAEAVRLAPSAMNRQPWRLRFELGALVIAQESATEVPLVTKALDCGIAMLHAELGALGAGVRGTWTDLHDGLDVACFEPVELPGADASAI